jgi:hypothetical protein
MAYKLPADKNNTNVNYRSAKRCLKFTFYLQFFEKPHKLYQAMDICHGTRNPLPFHLFFIPT